MVEIHSTAIVEEGAILEAEAWRHRPEAGSEGRRDR